MTGVLNEAMREGIPEEWRQSQYIQKGDSLKCNTFRGITLLSHALKLWESRRKKIEKNCEHQ